MGETPEQKKARETQELKDYLEKLEAKNNKDMADKGIVNPYAGGDEAK